MASLNIRNLGRAARRGGRLNPVTGQPFVRSRFAPSATVSLGAAARAGQEQVRRERDAGRSAINTVASAVGAGSGSPSSSAPAPGPARRPPQGQAPGPRGPRATHPGRVAGRSVGNAVASGAAAIRAIRGEVARRDGSPAGSNYSARSTSAPRPPSSGSSSPSSAPKPAASSPKGGNPPEPKAPIKGVKQATSKGDTLRAKAKASKVSPGSFDKATLNRAVSRFMATHEWARDPSQRANVRQVAAYLLSKEHKGYGGAKGLQRMKREH